MDWTFAGIKAALITQLKSFDSWKSEILTEGVYSNILDVISFIWEKLAYYVDFLFTETTSNAQLTESVIERSKFLGYIPPRKIGASGFLTIGTEPTFVSTDYTKYIGRDVPFKKWDGFSDSNNTTFVYATQDATFYSGSIQVNKFVATNQLAVQISNAVVGIPVIAHGFTPGTTIKINHTQNYDGVYTVLSSSTADRICITAQYVAEKFTGQEKVSKGYLYLPVNQGRVKSFTYITLGDINEQIPIYSANIDENNIEVNVIDVNGNILNSANRVSDLYFVNDLTAYSYQVDNFTDYTGINITFGDGITARQLAPGERLQITYAETDGADGNIGSSGIITKALKNVVDVYGTAVTVYITNEAGIIGGQNLQTIDVINKISGALFDGGYQLGKRTAWIAAVESVSFVQKAQVWTELDVGNGTLSLAGTPNQNVYYVTALSTDGTGLTVSQETQISTQILIPRKSPTDIVSWQKLKLVGIKFDVSADITSNLSIPDTQAVISNALFAKYDALQLDFKQEIYESNYWQTIQSVPNVIRHNTIANYVDMNIASEAVLLTTQVSLPAANQPDVTKQILLAYQSPEIWIRRKIALQWQDSFQIAQTTTVSFSGMNTYTVSGDIDYINNRVTYQCFDVINDTVPSIIKNCTTLNNNNKITATNVTNLKLGMFAFGLNIDTNAIIVDITGITITLNKPTLGSGAATGNVTFCINNDPGTTFGLQNPADGDAKGYILYLVYKTVDGNGNRLGDLRASNFDNIFTYSPELSQFNLEYPT